MFSSIVSKILGIFLERKKRSYGEPNQNSFVGIEMAPFARIQSSTNLLAMVCAAPYLQASQTAPVGILQAQFTLVIRPTSIVNYVELA